MRSWVLMSIVWLITEGKDERDDHSIKEEEGKKRREIQGQRHQGSYDQCGFIPTPSQPDMNVRNTVPKEENVTDSRNDDNQSKNIEENTITATIEEIEPEVSPPPPPPMNREWEVVGNREMSDEEYNLFVQRTTEHLLPYRPNDILNQEDEGELFVEITDTINPEFEDQEADEDMNLYPLLAATVANDLPTVLSLLNQDDIDKNERSSLGRTAIWYAAFHGHVEIQKLLIEQGIDVEKPDLNGRTPLFVACREGHLDTVNHLLEQGANRDALDGDGWTPLHAASFRDHLDIAKLLMVYGADLNVEYGIGITALNLAVSEEMDTAIYDETRRRMDHGYKRSTEQITKEKVAKEEEEEEEINNKRLGESSGEEENVVEGEVADEDQDSEPSDSEKEDNK